jgi:hypothetical protein
MIEIEAPDGSIAEFPDGTPDATIKAVMRKAYGGGQQPSVARDIATTLPGKLLEGAAAIPGAIGDLPAFAEYVADRIVGGIVGKSGEQVRADRLANQQIADQESGIPRLPNPQDVISTQKILSALEPVTGRLPQPQTTTGKYAGAIATMAPAALAGGGTAIQRAAQAVVPGVASEGAGQLTEGTAMEPWARALAAITGGGATALATRRPPEQVAAQAMGALDDATLAQAGRLMQEARNRGIDLSWPEAVQQITNSGTRLGDLQRAVEHSAGGGPIMREFYADRPTQIDAAARQQFDEIAPQPMIPERLGPRVQQAAEADIDAVRRGINQQTRPLYNAAANQVLPPNHPALQDPAFIEAVRQVRANPLIGPRLANLPDNSIGVIDEVQKILRDNRNNLRTQGRNYEASLTSEARRQVTNEARNLSPEYDAAVQFQRQARDQYLNPLEEGPTGKVSRTTDVGAQTQALFPNKPQAQSEVGTARAVRGIRRTDPEAAEGIVRQHLETAFNEASQRIQSGQNQFGGAKFSAVVAGNPQQRRNLNAAIRALPHGDVLWRGFNRFLDVLEATGKRPAPNSMTEFNAQIRKELEQGTMTGELATIAASPQKAITYIKDAYARFRLGRGTEQLARLFTEGNLRDFQRILRSGPNSPQAIGIMVRLISQANAGANAPGALAN